MNTDDVLGLNKPPFQTLTAVGVEIEEGMSFYFDADAMREVPYKLYRLDSNGHRFYYTLDSRNRPKFYISVTSKNNVVIPMGYGLVKFLSDNTEEESEYIKNSRACYGTMMHIEMSHLLRDRTYDLSRVPNVVFSAAIGGGFPELVDSWTRELFKDLLAFAAFIQKHNVKALAIEIMLKSDKHKYGGSIDLACELDIEETGFFGEVYKSGVRKGMPKATKGIIRKRAIIDYKSSKKGNFYEAHEVQLADYMEMWNENFPDLPVSTVFNYSPNDWRTEPTFKLVDQTGKCSTMKASLYRKLFKRKQIEEGIYPKDVLSVGGTLDLDKNLKEFFEIQSASKFIFAKHKEQRDEIG